MTSDRMDHYRVFAPEFIGAVTGRWEFRDSGLEACSAGPFRVIPRAKRFVVLNDPEPDDGPPIGEFTEDQWALLTAATFGAHYHSRSLYVAGERDATGRFPVVERRLSGGDHKVVGWMDTSNHRHVESIHVAEYILRSPHRLAHFLEAASGTALKDAAKILTRRLGLSGQDTPGGEDATGRVACRYRLEVVTETTLEHQGRPLKSGDEQARWLAEVIPRSPIEIGGGLYLDAGYWPIGYTQYDGAFHRVALEPRHIFAPALLLNAAYVSVWHTHPEQASLRPSEDDRRFTSAMHSCGRTLRIPVLTSIILGADNHFAFVPY